MSNVIPFPARGSPPPIMEETLDEVSEEFHGVPNEEQIVHFSHLANRLFSATSEDEQREVVSLIRAEVEAWP